jgi:hypothetical protein
VCTEVMSLCGFVPSYGRSQAQVRHATQEMRRVMRYSGLHELRRRAMEGLELFGRHKTVV